MIRVICPTYNRPERLERAVTSFLKQKTTVEKELIIVDNGCTRHINGFDCDCIHTVRNDVNENPCKAINDNILKGAINTLLFDDDTFADDLSLQNRINPILEGRADSTYSDAHDFGQSNRVYRPGIVDLKRILKSDCIYFGSLAWNDKAYALCGKIREDMWLQSDWLFKIKLFKYCKVEYVPAVTLMAEIHDGRETVKQDFRKERENEIIKNWIKDNIK